MRPKLGLRPWLAFLRRTLAFFFWVLFDIAPTGYMEGTPGGQVGIVAGDCARVALQSSPWWAT